MKKLLLSLFLLMGTFIFADGQYELLENRVENRAITSNMIKSTMAQEVDYDVDIYMNQMNFEIEIESMTQPNLNYSKIVQNVLSIVKTETPQIKEVYITIKYDPMMGNDKLLYSKTHFIK